MSQQHVGIGVGVIVVREGEREREILLVQRRHHGLGSWSTPGGYLNVGETPEVASQREVMEETGITIGEPTFRAITNDIHVDGKHNVTLWFIAQPVKPDAVLQPSDESLAIGWFPIRSLPEPIYQSLVNYLEGNTYPEMAPNFAFDTSSSV